MKKFIALLLSVFMIFSVFGMTVAFAADEETTEKTTFTVIFKDYDGTVISEAQYNLGDKVVVPENPERAATDEVKYIFAGWENGTDGEKYYKETVPKATEDVTYTATYGEQDADPVPTFWQLVRSVFARINAILEYLTRIFTKK